MNSRVGGLKGGSLREGLRCTEKEAAQIAAVALHQDLISYTDLETTFLRPAPPLAGRPNNAVKRRPLSQRDHSKIQRDPSKIQRNPSLQSPLALRAPKSQVDSPLAPSLHRDDSRGHSPVTLHAPNPSPARPFGPSPQPRVLLTWLRKQPKQPALCAVRFSLARAGCPGRRFAVQLVSPCHCSLSSTA